MTPAEQAQKEADLKDERERQARENAARRADLAALCASPPFQRIMLGPEGYLTGLMHDAEEDLLSESMTPVTDPARMVVNLTRWRASRALHADLKAIAATPPATNV